MKTVDEKALDAINAWKNQGYLNGSQSQAALHVCIISALKKQDRDTRHACCEAINEQFAQRWAQNQTVPLEAELTLAVMNVKAV